MAPIRVLTVGWPDSILGRIVERIVTVHEDIFLVDSRPDRSLLLQDVERTRPDVVLLAMEEAEPSNVFAELLEAFPGVIAVGVAGDGRWFALHMADIGPEELVNTIRAVRPASTGNRHG